MKPGKFDSHVIYYHGISCYICGISWYIMLYLWTWHLVNRCKSGRSPCFTHLTGRLFRDDPPVTSTFCWEVSWPPEFWCAARPKISIMASYVSNHYECGELETFQKLINCYCPHLSIAWRCWNLTSWNGFFFHVNCRFIPSAAVPAASGCTYQVPRKGRPPLKITVKSYKNSDNFNLLSHHPEIIPMKPYQPIFPMFFHFFGEHRISRLGLSKWARWMWKMWRSSRPVAARYPWWTNWLLVIFFYRFWWALGGSKCLFNLVVIFWWALGGSKCLFNLMGIFWWALGGLIQSYGDFLMGTWRVYVLI